MAEPTGVIRPQPRNAALGALADFLQRANTAAARVQFNPQIAPQFTLADLLPLEGAAGLMQDVAAYGPRAINKGGPTLQTFRLDPRVLDVAEAATYAAPLTRLARPAGRMAAQQIERAMTEGRGPLGAALAPVRPMNVIKPKGGNWLAGTVESAVEPLKLRVIGQDPANRLRDLEGALAQNIEAGVPVDTTFFDRERERLLPDIAINRWLDKKLAGYLRNEMATPEDPLRALAERGVSHIPRETLEEASRWVLDDLVAARKRAGYPELGFVEGNAPGLYGDLTELQRAAAGWEAISDNAIGAQTAGRLISPEYEHPAYGKRDAAVAEFLPRDPWLAKVPPETPVYFTDPASIVDLDFRHLVDELRNATNPESGLPRELLWRYSDLDKVTVPQAVQRVADINKWRAAQKAEADAARANNAASVEYRAYPTVPGTDRPNEKGLRWVELKAEGLPENADAAGRIPVEGGLWQTHPNVKALEDALKYEGETMGHCVGGYCPGVIEGKSRIFSLRDARGEPHVTVEVRPDRQRDKYYTDWMRQQPEAIQDEVTAAAIEYNAANPKLGYGESLNKVLRDRIGEAPDEIVQIKGKANKAPKEDYLPFVQDFVKSQQWGRVGDLRNTGLEDVHDYQDEVRAAVEQAFPGRRYLTAEELQPFINDQFSPSRGYAEGGIVRSEFEYDPAAVDARAAALMEEIDAA